MKNYIGFVNDHSGSMQRLRGAAIKDYNLMIAVIRDAASREVQDTIVSTIGIGIPGKPVQRQVVISNPHVLAPIKDWITYGNTPLYDGIGEMIMLFKGLPDADNPDVSFLISITTDGEENDSRTWSRPTLRNEIEKLQATGRWTFVCRVPKEVSCTLLDIGIPAGNIQAWNTSAAGMEKATVATAQAMDSYFTARSTGSRSSTTFYAAANKVDTSALAGVSKEVSLYVVPDHQMGIEIRDFILQHRMQYLKGSTFYQLTKTESRVGHQKLIAIRDRTSGHIYTGKDARKMIGLPTDSNARLHPGDHGNYDIFIQSESVNRKLVAGTGVLYWAKIGKPFTEADLAYLQPKPVAAPGLVQLPQVAPTNKPTKSPIPKTPRVPECSVDGFPVKFFSTRSDARHYTHANGGIPRDVQDLLLTAKVLGNIHDYRWYVVV